jgi:type IV secretion system protein VirB10
MAIDLAGRVPRVVSAISGRLIYLAVVILVLVVAFVAYGFHYRIQQKETMKQAVVTQVSASDSSASTREQQHPNAFGTTPVSFLNGVPSQPGTNMPGLDPNLVSNAVKGGAGAIKQAINTVAAPFPNNPNNMTAATPSAQTMPPPAPYYNPPPTAAVNPVATVRASMAARELERRQAAIEAPTGVSTQPSNNPAPSAADPLQADLARIAALSGINPLGVSPNANAMPPAPPVASSAAGLAAAHEGFDPNEQGQKRAFQDSEGGDYIKGLRVPPISPWVVERGDVIPAGLPTNVVSDIPGDLVAEVKRDVYDSPTHKYVMIPAGSLLAGEYNSSVSYGQSRVQVVWTYLRFPDGSYINLDRFVSHAADGSVGLKDQTDNHIKRLVGGVLLSSLFAAGIEISQNRNGTNSTLSYPSTSQVATSAIGQQVGQVGQRITERNLNVQPTLKIRPGYIFDVSVKKSMVFPGPYQAIDLEGGRK